MDISIHSVKGYNTPSKKIMMINNNPVAITNSLSKMNDLIEYIYTGNIENINDKSILRALKPYREEYIKNSKGAK